MNKIYRNIEIRAVGEDSRLVEGQAIVFDSWSRDLGGFHEIIRSSAVTQELVDNSNVIANIDHNNGLMVARWRNGKGTLQLELRSDGLYFSFSAPETERGNQLLWDIRHGNLYECSFCFSLPDNDTCQRWYHAEDGSLKREITQIGGLYDVAIVVTAAYGATSVDSREIIDVEKINRSLDEAEAEAKKAEEELRQKEEDEKKAELHKKLDEKLSEFYKNIRL